MPRRRPTAAPSWIGALSLLLPTACAAPPPLRSAAPDPPIAIDGAYAEWAGRFARIDAARNVGLAVAHDRDHLYLCLVTRDLVAADLLQRAGFTLWLDPQGGRERRLGVRVAPVDTGGAGAVTPSVEVVFDGAGYGYQLTELSPDGPLDVRHAVSADVVIYELRLALGRPLAEAAAARVTLRLGARLGIGLESVRPPPPPDAPELPYRRRRGDDRLEIWAQAELDETHR